jgi:hypothetical protein
MARVAMALHTAAHLVDPLLPTAFELQFARRVRHVRALCARGARAAQWR